MLFQNASVVCPERVRPLASVMVPEIHTGQRRSCSSKRVSRAKIAALALRVSKTVSTQQQVGAAVDQAACLLEVGLDELVEPDVACPWIVDVRRDGGGPVGRPERAGDVARAFGSARLVGSLAGQRGCCSVELVTVVLEPVVGLGDARRGEGVGADDVGPGVEVGAVDVTDDVGLRHRQDVGVALEVVAVVGERLAAVAGLLELVALDEGAHGTVDHQDALAQGSGELLRRVGAVRGCRHSSPLGPRCRSRLGSESGEWTPLPDGDTACIVAPRRRRREILPARGAERAETPSTPRLARRVAA